MELSKQTLDLFKNYATINSNLLIKPGTKISTKAATEDIVSIANVLETFDKEAGIYNLNEFLGVVSLFSKPDFVFEDTHVVIKEGKNQIKYMYADASLLTVLDKKITMPQAEINFSLSVAQLQKIQKAAAALSVCDLAFIGDGKTITAKVFDSKNPTSNGFELELDDPTNLNFSVLFKIEKLKMYQGNYDVSISKKMISMFKNKDFDILYYVAVETKSKFS